MSPGEERRPSPSRRYSQAVGLIFLIVVGFATVNLVNTRNSGVLGLRDETHELPLAEFAVPEALGSVEGDANVAQDDCEIDANPCPSSRQRKPACRVRGPGILTVCKYFDRPLVISFWFTRGGNCEGQQDVLSRVAGRYRGRVSFLSIDIHDARQKVRQLVRQRRWRVPVGVDRDGAVSDLYRIGGCPTFAYAYPGGILKGATIGQLDDAGLARHVDDLVAASARRGATAR
jgi:thiol-disulfide isomerase/thioredoxin